MYEITKAILEMFDVRRLKGQCNYPSCNKKPEKEILIYEYTIRKNIGITTLYLCKDHLYSARQLLRKIRIIAPKIIVRSKQKGIKI